MKYDTIKLLFKTAIYDSGLSELLKEKPAEIPCSWLFTEQSEFWLNQMQHHENFIGHDYTEQFAGLAPFSYLELFIDMPLPADYISKFRHEALAYLYSKLPENTLIPKLYDLRDMFFPEFFSGTLKLEKVSVEVRASKTNFANAMNVTYEVMTVLAKLEDMEPIKTQQHFFILWEQSRKRAER